MHYPITNVISNILSFYYLTPIIFIQNPTIHLNTQAQLLDYSQAEYIPVKSPLGWPPSFVYKTACILACFTNTKV